MGDDQSASDSLYVKQVLRATERAMQCAAGLVHQDLKHGLTTLATLASLAPLLGILGTVFGLAFDTFLGIGAARSTAMASIAGGISRACLPAAIGLVVGLQSVWCYRYFHGSLDTFDREMEDTRLKLVNQLALHFGRVRAASPNERAIYSLPYLEAYSPDLAADGTYRRLATIALLGVALCLQALAHFEYDYMPLFSALSVSVCVVVFSFCCTCLLAYAIWVDFLHRKSAAVALIAAALCVCWSVAGLLFPAARF